MYEFVGCIAGRLFIIEGTINSTSIISTALGWALMQIVSFYTKEESLLYYFVMLKFVLAWMVATSILGSIAVLVSPGFKYAIDSSPKTRAWLDGPHISGWMRGTREIASCVFGFFLPIDPKFELLISNGIGWNGFCALMISLWIFMMISETIVDNQLHKLKK